MCNGDLGRQTESLQTSPLPSFSHKICTEYDVVGYGIFLCPVRVSCPDCAPPACCAAPASQLESPWLCINTAWQQPTQRRVIRILLILNPKPSAIAATRKKMNSIPAETRTGGLQLCNEPASPPQPSAAGSLGPGVSPWSSACLGPLFSFPTFCSAALGENKTCKQWALQ